MTLDTRFRILDPIEYPQGIFELNRRIVGCPNSKFTVEENEIWNHLGQGFDALLSVKWGNPLPVDDCYCDELRGMDGAEPGDQCYACKKPPGYVEISWDTAYGYRAGERRCSDLHADYITLMARWCDDHNLRWAWENEYAGTWHTTLADLADFGQAGVEADQWFSQVALPAIEQARGVS